MGDMADHILNRYWVNFDPSGYTDDDYNNCYYPKSGRIIPYTKAEKQKYAIAHQPSASKVFAHLTED